MNRKYRELVERSSRDHTIAMVARLFLGAAGILAGVLILRSIPDLVRYVKMERM